MEDKDREAIDKILRRAWYSCHPCFGTGWLNYKDYRFYGDTSAKKADCPQCGGAGMVQYGLEREARSA